MRSVAEKQIIVVWGGKGAYEGKRHVGIAVPRCMHGEYSLEAGKSGWLKRWVNEG